MPISKIPVGAIQSGTIGTSQIADNAVTTAKILNDNVTSAKIPNSAVGSTEIASDAVTGDKIGTDTIKTVNADSIMLNSTDGTADAGDFLVLDGTDNSSSNANDRILYDETFVDKIGLFNINTLGSAGTALKVDSAGTGFEFGSAGGLVKLNTTDITSSTATVTFDSSLITDTYSKYILEYEGLKPATDNVLWRSRYSTDNGSSFETGTFSYGYHYSTLGAASSGGSGNTKSNYASNDWAAGNDANYPYNGTLFIDGLRDSSTYLTIRHDFIMRNQANNQYVVQEGWTLSNAVVYNYMEWSFSSGNIADGTFTLYGLAK